ncbi:MAG: class I SAM-dependent methyltransferase [Ignavibacteriales bacterium]|nr:class I SAM-dependent methyltransferase [Ignavibacteriales bacterium]
MQLKLVKRVIGDPKEFYKLVGNYEKRMGKYTSAKYGLSRFPTVNILDIFPDLDITIKNYTYLTGTSMVTDIALLSLLAKSKPDCDYMEIGSWRGESISNVAVYAKSCLSFTLSKEDIISYGWGERVAEMEGFFTQNIPNLTVIHADSAKFDFSTLNKKFDLIFIDGDHSYTGALIDTQNAFKLLKDQNSTIVWHDYAFDTEAVRHSVMAAILDGTPKEFQKNLYHVSNTMCAMYSPKHFNSYNLESPAKPDKTFTVNIKAERI